MAQVVACATNIGLFVMDFGGGGAGPAGIAMGVVRCPIASHERWIGCRGGGGGGGGSTSHSIPNDAIDKPTGIRALRVAVDDTGRIALQPCCIGGGSSDRLKTARIASYVCRAAVEDSGAPLALPPLAGALSARWRDASWLTSGMRLLPSVSGLLLCVLWPIARQFVVVEVPTRVRGGDFWGADSAVGKKEERLWDKFRSQML